MNQMHAERIASLEAKFELLMNENKLLRREIAAQNEKLDDMRDTLHQMQVAFARHQWIFTIATLGLAALAGFIVKRLVG